MILILIILLVTPVLMQTITKVESEDTIDSKVKGEKTDATDSSTTIENTSATNSSTPDRYSRGADSTLITSSCHCKISIHSFSFPLLLSSSECPLIYCYNTVLLNKNLWIMDADREPYFIFEGIEYRKKAITTTTLSTTTSIPTTTPLPITTTLPPQIIITTTHSPVIDTTTMPTTPIQEVTFVLASSLFLTTTPTTTTTTTLPTTTVYRRPIEDLIKQGLEMGTSSYQKEVKTAAVVGGLAAAITILVLLLLILLIRSLIGNNQKKRLDKYEMHGSPQQTSTYKSHHGYPPYV